MMPHRRACGPLDPTYKVSAKQTDHIRRSIPSHPSTHHPRPGVRWIGVHRLRWSQVDTRQCHISAELQDVRSMPLGLPETDGNGHKTPFQIDFSNVS